MHRTNLMAIQENGQKLVMMDGTIWIIHPDDAKETLKWAPPCGIQIEAIHHQSEFPYALTNTDEDITVPAQRRR